MKNKSKNTRRNRKNGTAKINTPKVSTPKAKVSTPKVSTPKFKDDEIITKLKKSLYSDKLIDMTIELYKDNPEEILNSIEAIKRNMKIHIACGWSVIDSYNRLLESRILRFGVSDELAHIERNIFKILFECFTKWGREIIFNEMKKSMKTQTINGVRVISFQ